MPIHIDLVRPICFNPDDTLFISALDNGTLKCWDIGGARRARDELGLPQLIILRALERNFIALRHIQRKHRLNELFEQVPFAIQKQYCPKLAYTLKNIRMILKGYIPRLDVISLSASIVAAAGRRIYNWGMVAGEKSEE